jgi:hypothetical protein
MILEQLTEAQADLVTKNDLIIEAAEATHHLAATLLNAHTRFWSLPTERLLAVLNADVATTLATFAANTALGTVANASLDALGVSRFPVRAPLSLGRDDIVFDAEQNVFVSLPAPPQDPLPEEGPIASSLTR